MTTLPSMTPPRHSFPSVREAAADLRDAATAAGSERLYLLPYNRYDSDDTEWWLSPEPANPAFKYGKILVARPARDRPDDLFVGLAFEKGVGPSTADAYPQDRRIDRTWAWIRTLTPALRSGAFQEAANRAESAAGLSLTVVISTGPPVPGTPPDIARFSWGGGTLRSIDDDVPRGRPSALRDASTLSALAPVLESVPDADWYWVDFNIGVVLVGGTAGAGATWSAGEIWRRACEPWVGWLG